jgi:threonine dehydrogenase-like Zn-dependent dehydrogenase
MATGNNSNIHQPAWVQTILNSVEGVREDVSDVKDDVRELRGEIKEVRLDVGGKDGLRERVATLEVTSENLAKAFDNLVETVSELATRETTPVSIVTSKKASTKEQAALVGGAGSVGAVILYILQLAGEYLKTK